MQNNFLSKEYCSAFYISDLLKIYRYFYKKNAVLNLSSFSGICLEDLERVSLQSRNDSKFLLHRRQLAEILPVLAAHYHILDMEGRRIFDYESIYFDTPDMMLYLQHHNGHRQRYKVRYRRYANSGLCFFEVKLKRSSGKMLKRRIQVAHIGTALEENAAALLSEQAPDWLPRLQPMLQIDYRRLTFADHQFTERATIDIDLNFRLPQNTAAAVAYPDLVIVELKQEKQARHSFISQALHDLHITESGLSKYCLGICHLYPHIKQNEFKKSFRRLEQVFETSLP